MPPQWKSFLYCRKIQSHYTLGFNSLVLSVNTTLLWHQTKRSESCLRQGLRSKQEMFSCRFSTLLALHTSCNWFVNDSYSINWRYTDNRPLFWDFFTWECWCGCFSNCLTANLHGSSIKLVVPGFPPWQMGGDASNDDSNNMYSPEVSAASTQNNSQGKTSSPSLYYLEAWQVSLLSQTLAFKLVAITYFSFFLNEFLMWTI